jgi:hypothetical protein
MCGGFVEDIEKSVVQPIGQGLADVDKFVGNEIPGGWVTVGLTAAGAYAYTEAANAAVAAGATTAEAATAGAAAAEAVEAASLLDAAALAEGGTTAGMAGAANTGLPAGTATLGGAVAESGGAPITDYSREVTLTPGGNAVPATTLPSEMAAIDAEIEAAAKALPSTISPMQALQGLRAAGGLLGGGQQPQQQQMPQMQMGGRTQMPQGAVDYSGIYNLLALQRARNPNSLLG